MQFSTNKIIGLALIIFSQFILKIFFIPFYNFMFEFMNFDIYQITCLINIWLVALLIFFKKSKKTA